MSICSTQSSGDGRRNGLLERVKAGHEQLERLDAELRQLREVLRLAGVAEQPGVHGRVQRLDPAVQALREAGHVLDLRHRQARRRDGRRGAAGRDDLRSGPVQFRRQVHQPGLVVDADQRPLNRYLGQRPNLNFLPWTVHPSRAIRPTVSTSSARSARLIRSCKDASSSSPRTGTAACAITGPLSTPASTRKTVHPVTCTPYSSASRTPCMPGNDGSNEGCVLMKRPPNLARKAGPDQLHEARGHHQVRLEGRARLGQRLVPVSASGMVGDPVHEGRHPGPLGPVQAGNAAAVGADSDHLCAVGVIGARAEQRLQVGPRA